MRFSAILVAVVALTLPAMIFAAPTQQVLVDFNYPNNTSAQAAWQAQEVSRAAEIATDTGTTALKMICDFATNERRSVYDMEVDWDLSKWHRFSIRAKADNPGAAGSFSLYFHSGDGWYSGSGTIHGRDWVTMHFNRSEFRIEENPAGWDKIDRVRIAIWRGSAVDSFCLIDDFTAYRDDILALIDPLALSGATGGEAPGVINAAKKVASMLREYGVFVGGITPDQLEADPQNAASLIILPYNPQTSPATAAALVEFIRAGGKVIAFYQLPSEVAEAMGIKLLGYVSRQYDGQFSSIRMTPDVVNGIPEQVGQSSWNITDAVPADDKATALGRWYDADGKDTGHNAIVMSDRGAFMTHILLSGDESQKNRMLLAMVGQFVPGVWETAASSAAEYPASVGHLSSDMLASWLNENRDAVPESERDAASLERVDAMQSQISAAIDAGEYVRAIELSSERNQLLIDAYTVSHRSRRGEFRAVWEHSGLGAYPSDWDKTMSVLRDAGFNAIMPNCLWGGAAYYESDVLPVADIVSEKGDQIAAAVAAGKRYGIEVHPWKVNFRLGRGTPQAFIDKMRAEGRTQVSFSGEVGDWLCPSHPANRELEIASMVEVATKYGVDGVHFDYIRYPGSQNCFCEGCHHRFEEATGITVENWPEGVMGPDTKDKFIQWRADQITAIVAGTAKRVHAVRPECKVSAAVFGSYPSTIQSIGQDWVTWAKEGYVDFLCPMDYTNSDGNFAGLIQTQLQYVRGAVPIYPGIGATSSSSTLSPDRVAGQIQIARNLGCDGFIIFNYTASLGENVLKDLGKAVTRGRTSVPHNGPRFDFGLPTVSDDQPWFVRTRAGQRLSVRLSRAADAPGIEFSSFSAQVYIEAPDGRRIRRLGAISSAKPELSCSFTLSEKGLYRIAVAGEAESNRLGRVNFTTRSIPVLVDGFPPDLNSLIGM